MSELGKIQKHSEHLFLSKNVKKTLVEALNAEHMWIREYVDF